MRIGAGGSLVVQFALTGGYCLLVIAGLQTPSSALAHVMAQWDRLLRPALKPVFDAIGRAPCAGRNLRLLQLDQTYIQLVLVDLVIAAGCYVACSPFWGAWAKRLRELPRWAHADPKQVESELEIGQGLTLAGAIGAAWLLLAGGAPFPGLFLRVPLIITVIYGLACFTAAFGCARAPTNGEPV